jgi:hypothetical protein
MAVQAALTLGVLALIRSGRIPLGVPGEWEWLRVRATVEPALVLIAIAVVGVYVAYAAVAARLIGKGGRAGIWLVGLVPLAITVQMAVQEGAPPAYGLEKWVLALIQPGSSGYYTVARDQIQDLPEFLAAYPGWIKGQDSFHIGTHPPGLFAASWGMLRFMETHPGSARAIADLLPRSFHVAFDSFDPRRPSPMTHRAALAATGFVILVACAMTCVPLYWLARRNLSSSAAWASAAIWPLVPAGMMFQPAADAAFPLLSTLALALAAWSGRRWWMAIAAGVVLGVGTQFTLAFFPVGLVAGIVMLADRELGWKERAWNIVFTGAGFLAVTFAFWIITGANPFAIWRTNAANHARFYVEYPKSYLAWVVENPIELAIALGVPTAVWAAIGLRRCPPVAWATLATLAFLTLSGKNLSEVARLWLPLMPPLVASAGAGAEKIGAGASGLAATLGLMAVQTLVLQATIQVVYPVS